MVRTPAVTDATGPSRSFQRTGGAAALVAGIAGFLYSVAFVIVSRVAPDAGRFLAPLLLVIGGIIGVFALASLYERLRQTDPGYALVGLLLGVIGAVGSAIHGAFDLATALHPPASLPDTPDAVDPRGFLTFGVAGIAILVLSSVMSREARFPRALAWLGYVSGTLLVLIYLGRLVILDATSPLILVPAGLEGFIVNPAWYLWLGAVLWRGRAA
ncbi:MAG: hypothetical protein ABR525_09105 [Candidatus Limnocylindria bacterium]